MFHVNNGLFFKRLNDGSVLIIKRADSSDNAQIVFEQIIDADVWASVVVTVSAYNKAFGLRVRSFHAAKKFHAGEIPESYLKDVAKQ